MPTADTGASKTANDARTRPRVCIIVPIYNESDTLEPLVRSVLSHCSGVPLQLVLVNDGSTDASASQCDAIAQRHPEVEVIHFPKNRGKTEALAAGFARAQGEIVITMDSDLQDDPAEIPRFLDAIAGGLDLVCGWKQQRHDPWSKRWASRVYNGFTARVFGLRLHDINCGFKAMRSAVARAAVLKHEYHRLIPAIAAAQGFQVGEIVVRHHPREFGTSKFGIERYWRGLRDVARLWWEIRMGRIGPANRKDA